MAFPGTIGVHQVLFQLLNIPLPPPGTVSIVFMISVGVNFLSSYSKLQDMILNPNPFSLFSTSSEVCDFIVVGGGSAGSVVANRLSENPNFKVCLLEAGGDPSILNDIPELAPYNLHVQQTDWKYLTVPQKDACLSLPDQRLQWPRGKVLGGSSVLNFMMYQRGHPKDFDKWATATGDSDWGFPSVLPYFKKSEDYHGNFPDETYHSTGGPLWISKQDFQPTVNEWVTAGREMGYPSTTDPNGEQVAGFWPTDVTIKEGFRASTYQAFIRPYLSRTNLRVIRYAHVTKVNLDESLRAVGVTYQRDGRTLSIKATKEVILSAGSIGTPQLLMLSGIGDPAHLSSLGITPKVNLPGVGQNLQDHVLTMIGPFLLDPPVSFLLDRDMNTGSAYNFVANRTGPFASNEVSGIGYITTKGSDDPQHPNIEFHQVALGVRQSMADDFTRFFGLKREVLREYFQSSIGKDANFVLVDLGRPASVGEIRLSSSNPFDHPLIDPKYYDKYEDVHAMVEALKFLVQFYETTKTWQAYSAHLLPQNFPGCEEHVFKSDEYFECYIRHVTLTIYHPCCTAKMGKAGDPTAVVTSKLNVIGVQGLRIADGSVMPQITNANLNAPIIMIAERASDLIKQSHPS